MAAAAAQQPKTHDDRKTADLEKVTDYVEDSEIKDKDIAKVSGGVLLVYWRFRDRQYAIARCC